MYGAKGKKTLLFMCQLLTMIDSDKSVCVSRHWIYRPSRSLDKTAKNHFRYFFLIKFYLTDVLPTQKFLGDWFFFFL